MAAIEVLDLTKTYRNGVQALRGLSLNVRHGEIFALLGENGSGKSTLIHILSTFLSPTSGKAAILGKNLCREAAAIRSEIACVGQRISIDRHLSLRENMLFQSKLYQIPKAEALRRMDKLIAAFGLERYAAYPVSSYSGGVKRRLDIALNMMPHPKILFLDEPTVGMDAGSRAAMWEMMKTIREDFGTTIILTTHYLDEADQLSDTVCMMKDGKEILQDSPFALRTCLRQDRIRITFPGTAEARTCQKAFPHPFGQNIVVRGDSLLISSGETDSTAVLNKTARFLLQNQISFTGISVARPSLEEVFLHMTRGPEGGTI